MRLKQKTCKQCKAMYTPTRPLQSVCGIGCAIQQSRDKRRANVEKKRRAQTKQQRRKLRTHAEWVGVAQAAVNSFCRARDEGLPCISCGRYKPLEAGHWRSRAAYPELRFDTRNLAGQCAGCNRGQTRYKRGGTMFQQFTEGMRARYGEARVEWCFGPHEHKKYSNDDLERMARIFRRRAKIYRRLRDANR